MERYGSTGYYRHEGMGNGLSGDGTVSCDQDDGYSTRCHVICVIKWRNVGYRRFGTEGKGERVVSWFQHHHVSLIRTSVALARTISVVLQTCCNTIAFILIILEYHVIKPTSFPVPDIHMSGTRCGPEW